VDSAAYAPDGTLYVGGDFGEIFRRSPEDEVFTGISHLAFSPESIDTDQLRFPRLIVDARNPSRLYRGRQLDLWSSADSGRTWQQRFAGTWAISAFALDPGDARVLYLGTLGEGGGLWVSRDLGATWSGLAGVGGTGFPGGVRAIVAIPGPATTLVVATGSESLVRSRDGGATWEDLETPRVNELGPSILALGRGATPSLFTFAGATMFVSRDQGTTWRPRARLRSGPPTVLAVAKGGTLLAGCNHLFGVGTALGEHWQMRRFSGVTGPLRFHPTRRGEMLTPAHAGLYRTTDAGKSWSWQGEIEPTLEGGDLFPIFTDVAFHPVRPNQLWAAAAFTSPGVFRSQNNGGTWTKQAEIPVDRVRVLDPRTIIAAGCGLYRSTDGGASWRVVLPCIFGDPNNPVLQSEREVRQLEVDLRQPGRVYAAVFERPFFTQGPEADEHLLASEDFGRTWRVVADHPHFVLAGEWLYGKLAESWHRSRDGGHTWSSVNGPPGGFEPPLAAAGNIEQGDLLMVGTSPIYLSRDGAETWTVAHDGAPLQAPDWLVANPREDAQFFASWSGWVLGLTLTPSGAARGSSPVP
jgi:photosystem II stability/assembly factor-like uncharacterized protein